MIVPDINLLLYAVVDGFLEHPRARVWWEQTLSSNEPVAIAAPALFGFVRLATSARVFDRPLAVNAALDHVSSWLDRPNVQFLGPGPRHLELCFALLRSAGTAANLTTDVQLAATAVEYQATLCSNDSDFARFAGLRWVNPLA
ncbi:MAG: type II toxin-antitoxin system VapC family toxin [Myxococcota bacterium]